MSKPKGKLSVRAAVLEIYPKLPRRFTLISLHAMVARAIGRPMVFSDTVRRKLFELREEKIIQNGRIIKFKNIDKARSIYQKVI